MAKRKISSVKSKGAKIPKKTLTGDYLDLSEAELLEVLKARDATIATLEADIKKLRAGAGAPTAGTDPATAKAAATKMYGMAAKSIKAQMKWKKSLANGSNAAWSWSSLCDEATFRAFVGYTDKDKTKGKKMPLADFEHMLGGPIEASARYSEMGMTSTHITIHYKEGVIKMGGKYGKV